MTKLPYDSTCYFCRKTEDTRFRCALYACVNCRKSENVWMLFTECRKCSNQFGYISGGYEVCPWCEDVKKRFKELLPFTFQMYTSDDEYNCRFCGRFYPCTVDTEKCKNCGNINTGILYPCEDKHDRSLLIDENNPKQEWFCKSCSMQGWIGHERLNELDNINPSHYKSLGATCSKCDNHIECIDVTRHMNFNIGNVIKYLWRSDLKNGLEDLKKAQWYLNDYIKQLEKKNDVK